MSSGGFVEFVRVVHGHDPFPWQQRLLRQVLEDGWPQVIAAPTASGKTSVIDVAVFALASEAGADAKLRRQPRRIFFVIDRRVVVDQAYLHALKVASALAAAQGAGSLGQVADWLRSLGGDAPLMAARMRGGMYRDQTWTRSPAQPVVCVATVDQLGSRLLFRGYGLSHGARNMLPVHAGLAGNDALIVLDEAHLSRAFDDTLSGIARYRDWAEQPIAAPWAVVRMTATPGTPARSMLELNERDERDPELGRRLRASKPTQLAEVQCETAGKGAPPAQRAEIQRGNVLRVAEAAAGHARALHDADPSLRVIGVVLNRVAGARAAFEALRAESDADAVLLTGRARPFDRDRLLDGVLPRCAAGRERHGDERTLFVVATRCIEVGADLDFDALVSECAALDALRQRFGRLDRLGRHGSARAIVLVRTDQVRAAAEPDPVYGEALGLTWRWLIDQAASDTGKRADRTLDMGVAAITARLPESGELALLCTPQRPAPVLFPAYLDLWAQTSPVPVPDPDVSVFLHGTGSEPADVQIVWRADLPSDRPETWADTVAVSPPIVAEALPMAAEAVRAWLHNRIAIDAVDVEGAHVLDADESRGALGRPALRWQGADADGTAVVKPGAIGPGDTIVVPSAYGGADEFGWNPDTRQPVADVGDPSALAARALPTLRLHPTLLDALGGSDLSASASLLAAAGALVAAEDREDADEAETAILSALAAGEHVPDWTRTAALALGADARRTRVPYPDGSGVVLTGRRRIRPRSVEDEADPFSDEDEGASLTRRVALAEHLIGVEGWTRRLAAACGVADELGQDLALAASLHDAGKVDPRFQVLLHGGDEVAAALAGEPLAKSDMDRDDVVARRRARRRSGYPPSAAHELASVALLTSQPAVLDRAHDPDLVLHLVASHHGRCRPFAPSGADPDPVTLRFALDGLELSVSSAHDLDRADSGVVDRFWRLTRRYGWHGLAYLEALLRLADHARSAQEQHGDE